MAGAKETPRQKMIGMMYLVLTALLALNVSRTVLEKFIFINDSLKTAVDSSNKYNNETISRISDKVKDANNREQDVAVLNTAKEVRKETAVVLSYLEGLKQEIIDITGGKDKETGEYPGLQNEEKVSNLMIQQKKGEELKSKLNGYVTVLRSKTGESFADIAYDGKDHPTLKNDRNAKKKDFANLNFAQTPMSAAMATLTQFESEVMARETEALDNLASKVGAGTYKFDNIIAMVNPESKVVAAGTKYTADMFVAASASGISPEMFFNGKAIPVENGTGKVTFTASPGTYKDGMARKTFEAMIKIREDTFKQTIEYFVAQPVIQVQSQSVNALYLNCGNALDVQVPALGAAYNPAFSGSGAAFLAGSTKGLVTVVPTSGEVKLIVKSNGNLIGTREFKVRPVPKPEIRAFIGNKPVNQKVGMNAPGPRSLTIRAIPEAGFKQFLPKDARYRVTKYEITLARGKRPVDRMTSTSPDVNLTRFASKARAGDRIVIEVKGVQRLNFRDKRENVNVGTPIIQIPLN